MYNTYLHNTYDLIIYFSSFTCWQYTFMLSWLTTSEFLINIDVITVGIALKLDI